VSEITQSKALVRCPPPSQIFQGRQDILEKMDACFSNDTGERHVYVLHGLGGSGKTQIALKFLDMTNKQNPRCGISCNVQYITTDDST
jgi:Cdc6-like AAA superfamily ATPase